MLKSMSGMRNYAVFVPLIAAVVMVGVVLVVWIIVKNEQDFRFNADMHSNTERFAARLETHIATRLDVAKHIQDEWSKGRIKDQADFQQIAYAAHNMFQDFQAINWINPDGVVQWKSVV